MCFSTRPRILTFRRRPPPTSSSTRRSGRAIGSSASTSARSSPGSHCARCEAACLCAELPEVMVDVFVLRHAPLGAGQRSEEAVHAAVTRLFSGRGELTDERLRSLSRRLQLRLVMDDEV